MCGWGTGVVGACSTRCSMVGTLFHAQGSAYVPRATCHLPRAPCHLPSPCRAQTLSKLDSLQALRAHNFNFFLTSFFLPLITEKCHHCLLVCRALHSPSTLHVVRELDPDTLMMGLKRCFEAYNAWNNAIDRSGMDKVG